MGSCLAVEKFEAGSLEAACIHGLPNDPPAHSQTRPLKKTGPLPADNPERCPGAAEQHGSWALRWPRGQAPLAAFT